MLTNLSGIVRAVALAGMLTAGHAAAPSTVLQPAHDPTGRGWREGLVCLGCTSGLLAASVTGSVIAIGEVLAAAPELGAFCVYSCVNWAS